MIKYLAIAAVVSLGSLQTQAQMMDSTISAPTAMTEEEATNAVNEFVQFMNEITEALESVTDISSADAAAERLQTIKMSAAGLQAKMDQVSAMDPSVQQKLLPIVLNTIVEHGQRANKAIENIKANDCYGSQALREMLEELKS